MSNKFYIVAIGEDLKGIEILAYKSLDEFFAFIGDDLLERMDDKEKIRRDVKTKGAYSYIDSDCQFELQLREYTRNYIIGDSNENNSRN